jgi:hypothetical protein
MSGGVTRWHDVEVSCHEGISFVLHLEMGCGRGEFRIVPKAFSLVLASKPMIVVVEELGHVSSTIVLVCDVHHLVRGLQSICPP